ncbi:hypothetical protein FQN54_005162 [Arachnomyces sp. PD_36]|nr:hypothetical protein FQN54_005162 [Arachnomyces sp. PD_36]
MAHRDETGNPEFTLQFRITPPASVQPGVKFTLPVIVATRPAAGRHPLDNDPGQQLMLYASLRDESGRNPAGAGTLTGELSDGVHSHENHTAKGYSKFNNLAIHRPGRFRLRIYLGASAPSGLVNKAYTDSHVIRVDPSAEMVQRPSSAQLSTLRELMAQNLRISEGDLSSWRDL